MALRFERRTDLGSGFLIPASYLRHTTPVPIHLVMPNQIWICLPQLRRQALSYLRYIRDFSLCLRHAMPLEKSTYGMPTKLDLSKKSLLRTVPASYLRHVSDFPLSLRYATHPETQRCNKCSSYLRRRRSTQAATSLCTCASPDRGFLVPRVTCTPPRSIHLARATGARYKERRSALSYLGVSIEDTNLVLTVYLARSAVVEIWRWGGSMEVKAIHVTWEGANERSKKMIAIRTHVLLDLYSSLCTMWMIDSSTK